MSWALEKTSGTLTVSTNLTSNNKEQTTSASIEYSGALFILEIEHFITVKSLTNFSFLYHPAGIAWSEYIYNIEDLCAVEAEERICYPVPVAYHSTLLPFAGYSYLKLNYKPHYSILPDNAGHNVYQTFLFGLEYDMELNRTFRTESFVFTSPLGYRTHLANTNSRYLGYGSSFIFEFEYFGMRTFFSVRINREQGDSFDEYSTQLFETGFTFRFFR